MVYKALRKAGIQPFQPELILYHTTEYKETDLDVEAVVAVAPRHVDHQPLGDTIRFRELPGHQLAASLIYEGPLRDVVPAVLELLGWVAYQEHLPAGPLHTGEVVDEEAVTELLLAIKPAASRQGTE